MTRREFLRRGAGVAALAGLGGGVLGAYALRATSRQAAIPRLPAAFDGLRVALIADTHHGLYFPLATVDAAVRKAGDCHPDLVLLLGDYAYGNSRYLAPALERLATLTAPLGVYAVLGNHDNHLGRQRTMEICEQNGIPLLLNRGVWLERSGHRIFLAGIDDLWTGFPDLDQALKGTAPSDCVLLASHNPDVIEQIQPGQAAFVFAGHTHGGQFHIPFLGSPIVPSKFGQKYRYGFVAGPHVAGYVTSGVGSVFPPVRFNCPPEIACLTLHPA
jgi:predicted MPP superfamily phosphohydrolase